MQGSGLGLTGTVSASLCGDGTAAEPRYEITWLEGEEKAVRVRVLASLDQTVRVWDIGGLRKRNVAPVGDGALRLSGAANLGLTDFRFRTWVESDGVS